MTALTFDTHAAIKEMKDSGLAEAHAESIVSAIQANMGRLADVPTKADLENLATKADWEKLLTKADLENLATKADWEKLLTKADLENLATKADWEKLLTKTDLRAIKTELKATRAELKAALRHLELSLTIQLGLMMLAVASLAVAAGRFL